MTKHPKDNLYPLHLSKFRGFDKDNLMELLSNDISREKMLECFQHIERYNDPSEITQQVIQRLKTELETRQPKKLPSFALLTEWDEFSSKLIAYVPRDPLGTHKVYLWNKEFEKECFRYVCSMYGVKPDRAPKCSNHLLSLFQMAVKEKPSKNTLSFWRTMLKLWLKILPEQDKSHVKKCLQQVEELMKG